MKKILAAALFAATVGGLGAANAMPLAPLGATTDNASIIQVAQGCGPGFARGPRGGCRPMFRGPPPRGPRFCPPGTFRGPYGGCRRRY
jgi:hypothetical protein